MSVTGALDEMSSARKGDLMLYTATLVYCNSLINPAIYALKIPAIRARYRAIFCRCRKTTGQNSTASAVDAKSGTTAATAVFTTTHTL